MGSSKYTECEGDTKYPGGMQPILHRDTKYPMTNAPVSTCHFAAWKLWRQRKSIVVVVNPLEALMLDVAETFMTMDIKLCLFW